MIVKPIVGKYVILKSPTVEDAEFTLKLRQDPQICKYLPCINSTVEKQKEWIDNNRKKEDDYFFVVWTISGNRIGTISVYDITENSGEGGRLALIGTVEENVEATLLLYDFCFNNLQLKSVTGYVMSENKRAIRFNVMMGVTIGEPICDEEKGRICKTNIDAEGFLNARKKLEKILYKKNNEVI